MKLLSLWEPWATLMAVGAKKIETRSWGTHYRGWLAIQAAKCWNAECQRWVCEDVFVNALEPHYKTGHADDGEWLGEMKRLLPRGHIVAVVKLIECCPTEARICVPCVFDEYREMDTPQERAFGDYSAGRYGWVTGELFRLPEPIPFKAKQGLCDVPIDVVSEIQRQHKAVYP